MNGFSPQNARTVSSDAFSGLSIAKSTDVHNVPSVANTALAKLTEGELQRIAKMRAELLKGDQTTLVNFDASIHSEITKLAEEATNQIKSSDVDVIGDKLTNIIVMAKGMNVGVQPASKIPVLGGLLNKFRNTKERIIGQLDTVGDQITKVLAEVDPISDKLHKAAKLQETLFDLNVKQYKELELMVISGRMTIEELLAEINTFVDQLGDNPSQYDVQQINDARTYVDSLEMKVHNWEVLKMSSVQLAPTIRQIQMNGVRLIERFKLVRSQVVPLWKRQFMVAMMVDDQAKGAALDNAITDASNQMAIRTATMLKETSIAVARNSQRGILDMSTIEHVQNELITGIDEVVAIAKEGKHQRQVANARLAEMQTQLQTKLIQRN